MNIRSKPFLLWLPTWVVLSLVIGLVYPGAYNSNTHWAESFLWSLGYTGINYLIGYWIVRLVNRDLHPAWRVLAGASIVVFVFFWNVVRN